MTYGSNSIPSLSLNNSMQNNAPSFEFGEPDVQASSRRLTKSYFLRQAMPVPLTAAEIPYAAPLLEARESP